MDKPLFVISELVCAYKRGSEVLRIKSLEIPSKQFVVLLGKSGSGKSTLLETLGLMNDTIKSGDVVFYPENSPSFSYKELWETNSQSALAQVRKEHFSFIFQNTNLMHNFTALENACLSLMIQGCTFSEALNSVRLMMNTMGLSEVDEWKRASELSGGQRQRVAFVRAVTPSFTILFGDEPMGNLD
jgi:ABC-type lipoprotein export system ATPase subunit